MMRPWLAPFMPLYAAGAALRDLCIQRGWASTRRLRFPVISIGNLSTGGSGKTPFAIALAKLLTARGVRVDVLSRGYGRQSRLPARVRPDGTAEEFGDEPLLIARETGIPVYVAPQRYDAGVLAEAEAQRPHRINKGQLVAAHILDDGFQHRQLARDVDILLLNRADWQDNLLPAGNLREAHVAVRRAAVVAIPADEPQLGAELKAWGYQGSIWHIHRRMEVLPVKGPIAAFCGIARPGQFFAGLKAGGLTLTSETAFPDHHRYTARDWDRLSATAQSAGAVALFTTAKDAVRMGPVRGPVGLHIVRFRIEIGNEAQALEWLIARLPRVEVSAPL
jgi:tetraacyldisaccharide 4'-kinase